MTNTIASRCRRRIATILRTQRCALRAEYEARRWRRALLRSLRRRSRE